MYICLYVALHKVRIWKECSMQSKDDSNKAIRLFLPSNLTLSSVCCLYEYVKMVNDCDASPTGTSRSGAMCIHWRRKFLLPEDFIVKCICMYVCMYRVANVNLFTGPDCPSQTSMTHKRHWWTCSAVFAHLPPMLTHMDSQRGRMARTTEKGACLAQRRGMYVEGCIMYICTSNTTD